MKKRSSKVMTIALFSLMSSIVGSAQAGIINTDANGTVTDTVTGYDGWLNAFPLLDSSVVDFLVFETIVASLFSIEVASDTDFGISIYQGQIANDSNIPFQNNDDFFDFNSTLNYIAGTPSAPIPGSSLSNISLSSPGFYTVALGGDAVFGPSDDIAYTASLNTTAVETVPTPSLPALLAMGLVALRMGTKRRSARKGLVG